MTETMIGIRHEFDPIYLDVLADPSAYATLARHIAADGVEAGFSQEVVDDAHVRLHVLARCVVR